jgi:hypothetical protein
MMEIIQDEKNNTETPFPYNIQTWNHRNRLQSFKQAHNPFLAMEPA